MEIKESFESENAPKLPGGRAAAVFGQPQEIAFEKKDFRLADVFGNIESVFDPQAQNLHLRLLAGIDPNLPATVAGDAQWLGRILSALVENAINHTAKGFVELNARQVRRTDNIVTVEFKVTDTGSGMAKDKLATVFDDQAARPPKPGHAYLTLPAAKQLVEMQGGMIHAKSKPGMGSAFTVLLTFEMPPPPAGTPPGHPAPQPLTDARVLLVEDNRINQLVVRKFLEKWGVQVDVAENGIEAVEKLRLRMFDLILMDLQMPGMDGYKTARHIRYKMEPPAKNTPIVALTASDVPDVRRKVLEAAMDDLVTKPFDPRELYLKILKFANRNPAAEAAGPAASAVDGSPAGHVNLQYLEDISANNREFVNDMLRLFVRQMPQFVRQLRAACETADWPAVRYSVHKMKSSVATVGISELEPVMRQLEMHATRETNAAETIGLVAHLEQVCEKVYGELRAKLGGTL